MQSGSKPENAEVVADVLVAADLRGISSHGVNRLELYCDELTRGAVDPNALPVLVVSLAFCWMQLRSRRRIG